MRCGIAAPLGRPRPARPGGRCGRRSPPRSPHRPVLEAQVTGRRRRAARRRPARAGRAARARPLQHRVAGHVELAGGERPAGRRGERGVADVDADVAQRHAEHLGGDLAERGGLAGAEVGDAAADQQACRPARRLDPAGRPVAKPDGAAVGLHVAGEAAADTPARPARARPARPAPRARRRRHSATATAVSSRSPVGIDVALGEEVALAHRLRGQAEAVRRAGPSAARTPKVDLHRAEPAEGAGRDVVGEHRASVDARRRARGTGPTAGTRAGEQHPRAQERVGAGVADDVDLLGDDACRRCVAAGAVAHDERVALRAGHAATPAASTPSCTGRRVRQTSSAEVRLDGHVLLAAEPAAHVRADHPDPALGQRAGCAAIVAACSMTWVDDPQGQHPVAVDPADARLRLEVGVVDVLGAVRRPRPPRRPRRAPPRRRRAGSCHSTRTLPVVVDQRRAVGQGAPRASKTPGSVLVLDHRPARRPPRRPAGVSAATSATGSPW